MRLSVNGVPRELVAGSLSEALEELGFRDSVVATAVNEDFVPAIARAGTRLNEGDRIEIVAPMQGG